MLIKREIFKELENEINNNKIIALVGLRQVGKTTLLKELKKNLKNSIFITFDKIEDLELFEKNIELFIEKYVKNYNYLFIDEFQYAKEGGKKLKYIHDNFNSKIFISGSSHPEIAIQSLQYLVGRVIIHKISPINFREFINYKLKENSFLFEKLRDQKSIELLKNLFQEYLLYGSYPEIIITENFEEKKKLLSNLVNTYLLKEIKDILDYKNNFEFYNVLKRIAIQDGKILNKNYFSNELEINYKKISEIFNMLEKTFIVSVLRPFFKNKIKEQIKSPKIYLQDLGFKNTLLNSFNELDLRIDKGEIYENFIFNSFKNKNYNVNYWNFKNNYEMDFVLEKDGKIFGFEIKSKINNKNPTNSIKKFIEEFNPKIIFVFNENLDYKIKFNNTDVIYTNFLNIFYIMNKYL
jgi:uncharacterized protein